MSHASAVDTLCGIAKSYLIDTVQSLSNLHCIGLWTKLSDVSGKELSMDDLHLLS